MMTFLGTFALLQAASAGAPDFPAIDGDTVRRHDEASTDQGLTWQTRYDFIYRRRKGPGQ